MKNNSTALLMALALALPAVTVSAQDKDQPGQPRGPRFQQRDGDAPDGPRDGAQRPQRSQRPDGGQFQGGQPQGGQPRDGQRPPAPPLMAALDTDGDGTLSEKEISAAAKSLKKLDKNKDGKLTMDELRPVGGMRPQGGGFGSGGPNGQGGPRPPREGNFSPDGGNSPRPPGGFQPGQPGGQPQGDGERPPRRNAPPGEGEK